MWEFPTPSSSNLSATKPNFVAMLIVFFALVSAEVTHASDTSDIRILSPCTESEVWKISAKAAKEVPLSMRQFPKLLTVAADAPLRAFAESITWRQQPKISDTSKALADYALARSLHHAAIFGLAAEGFDKLIAQPTNATKAPIQIAAISCLGQIHRRYPAFVFSAAALNRIPELVKKGNPSKRELNILWYGVTQRFLSSLDQFQKTGNDKKEAAKKVKEVEKSLQALKGSGPYEALASGMWEIQKGHNREAIPHLTKFVKSTDLTESLNAKRDAARLMLARAHYELDQFRPAIKVLEAIDKRSNELVHSLIYLSTAQLMANDYPKAVGAAMGLQAGGLRDTFAPESMMVAAISFNELCLFPESLAMVNRFRTGYQKTFFWLRDRQPKNVKDKEPLYPIALAFLKGAGSSDEDDITSEAGAVPLPPYRIGSEWIRSPIFISKQESINHLFRTLRKIPKLVVYSKSLHKNAGYELKKRRADVTERYQAATKALKKGETLSKGIKEEWLELKDLEFQQAKLGYSLPFWAKTLTNYRDRAKQWQAYLIGRIEREIAAINQRMYADIVNVMENNELIEAEIWNGASQDLVWQNAHPEFQNMVKTGKISSNRGIAGGAGDVYNWGKSGTGFDGKEEVWEDEVGSIRATLQNNCANKEKYMKIQKDSE